MRIGLLVALLFLASACASVPRTEGLKCDIADYASQPFPTWMRHPEPGFNMPVLGAGGQYGAYGAGFLEGWSRSETAPIARSDVHVVTGVSAGAIFATHAFLGKDQEAAAILGRISDADVLSERFPLFALFSNSLFETSAKDETIARYITNELRGGPKNLDSLLSVISARGGDGIARLQGDENGKAVEKEPRCGVQASRSEWTRRPMPMRTFPPAMSASAVSSSDGDFIMEAHLDPPG